MKKVLVLFLLTFVLFGCEKAEETDEVKLCNKVDQYIEKYKSKEINYNEVASNLNNLYNEYCGEENTSCYNVKEIQKLTEQKYEIKDCSIQKSDDLKKLCEITNESVKKRMKLRTQLEESYISELARSCALARENK